MENNTKTNRSRPNEDEDDIDNEIDLNALLHYIVKYGTIIGDKGTKVLNPDLIYLGNKQVIIKHSLFKYDRKLKEKLLNLPREGVDDVLRMVIESIHFRYLSDHVHIELYDWEIILIDDDSESNSNSMTLSESTNKKSNGDNHSQAANNESQQCDKDNLSDNILKQVTDIVTGHDPNGIIRISIQDIKRLGIVHKEEFEDEILYKIFKKVGETKGMDIEKINLIMVDKLAYLE